MKQELSIENSSDCWCVYCKEEISLQENTNYVVKDGKYYHLECYYLFIGIDQEEISCDA